MTNLEKGLLGGLGLLLVVLALLTYSLRGDLKALTQGLQVSLTRSLSGLTNYDELAPGDMALKYQALSLGSGATTTTYTNRSPSTEFVTLGSWSTSGTASSSFTVALFASSSPTITSTHSMVRLVLNGNGFASSTRIIDTITLATGTRSTATSSLSNRLSDGMVEVKKGQSIHLTIQKGDFTCDSIPTANGCESASSTNRGFNISAFLELLSTSTQR